MDYRNLKPTTIEGLTTFFKVLGDDTRLRIVMALSHTELCVSDLAEALAMTDSAVSHQLKTLKNAGLIKSRRDGKNIYYSLDDDHVELVLGTAIDHVSHML